MPPRRNVRRTRPPARPAAAAAPPRVVAVRDRAQWTRVLERAGAAVVCVAFTSAWSATARQARAYFQDLARRPAFSHVRFALVDLGDASATALAETLGVASAPAFQVWKGRDLVASVGGGDAARLPALLAETAGPPPAGGAAQALRAAVAVAALALASSLLSGRREAARLAALPPAEAEAARAAKAARAAARRAARTAGRRKLPIPGTHRRVAAVAKGADDGAGRGEEGDAGARVERGEVGAAAAAVAACGDAAPRTKSGALDVAAAAVMERLSLYGRMMPGRVAAA